MKRKSIITFTLTVGLIILVLISGCDWLRGVKNLKVRDWCVNFDAHVWFADTVNDFHLYLDNITPSQITDDYFHPVGSTSTSETGFDAVALGSNQTRVEWTFDPAVSYCDWLHFGVGFDSLLGVRPLFGAWTYNDTVIAVIPFVLQSWEIEDGNIIADVIWNPDRIELDDFEIDPDSVEDGRDDVTLTRSWAFSEEIFELSDMMWDNVKLDSLEWKDEEQLTIDVGGSAELEIEGFKPSKYKSVLVRYSVSVEGRGDIEYHYINQAVIEEAE